MVSYLVLQYYQCDTLLVYFLSLVKRGIKIVVVCYSLLQCCFRNILFTLIPYGKKISLKEEIRFHHLYDPLPTLPLGRSEQAGLWR